MPIHILAVVLVAHQSVRRDRVDQILHAQRNILPILALARKLAGRLEGHEGVARDGDGVLLLHVGRGPCAVGRLLGGEPLERALDDGFGFLVHAHGVAFGGSVSGVKLRNSKSQYPNPK